MREAQKQQEHGARNVRMLRAQSIRTLARHTSPGDASFESRHDCRRHETKKKCPKQRSSRSGQLARLTEEIRAGKKPDCCDDAAFVGGDRKQSPQQPCSRPLYQTGRVHLPGVPGLDGTSRPGRRRAEARYVRRRGSFSGLQFYCNKLGKTSIVDADKSAPICRLYSAHPIARGDRAPSTHRLRRLVTDTYVGREVRDGWP